MASSKDYLCTYKKFFEDFAASIEPYDQLPVKVAGYFIRDSEVTGEIVDWTLQYLSQKRCPSSLLTPLVKIVIDEMKVACAKKAADCGFVAHENVYQPLRLMNAAMTKVNEVCLRYKDNGQLHTLPEPAPKSYISACAIKNSRRRMEDRHVVIEDFHGIFGIKDCGPASYFAVFDGHAGVDAASYSVSHLHQFLAESRYYPADPERALKDAFFRTDSLFIEKSNMENLHSGTTAVCALLRPNDMLYVAWLGDSQALLVRRGQPISIVNPHKPDRKDERKRIEGMGGSVLFWGTWRVNGQLAVSRAIGDVEYKPYVTAEPDVVAVPLDGTEDFLILGCDGLWDFVPEEAIVHAVYEQLKNSPGDLEAVTENLVQLSKQQGSTDNISVIVVFLTEPTKLLDAPQLLGSLKLANTMDTKSDTNSCQKPGFLLDLDSGGACKQNGTDLDHIYLQRSTNGKDASEGVYDDYDDEDFGPETDVDTVDDVLLSPAIAAAKMLATTNKNQLLIENQTAVDISPELQKDQLGEFDASAPRGDTPTPPADEVANSANREVVDVDNAGESGEDSDDEWNYFAVEKSKKTAPEPLPLPQQKTTVCDISEAEQREILDMESRLNPNAAEFVPSPTHVVPALEDCLLACSPRKDEKREIAAVPSEQEFGREVRKCPSEEIEPLDNHISAVEDLMKPQFVSSELQSTVLQTPDFFSSSVMSKNPFGDDFKNVVNEKVLLAQNEAFRFNSVGSIKSEFLQNSSEPLSFELKKEVCPEMEPEPERVCLDALVDDLAENGVSSTASPDVSESSHDKDKNLFEPYIAICPPKPSDLKDDFLFEPEKTLDSIVGQIHEDLKESADIILSSCTSLPDTTGLDETGGSVSPLGTDAVENKADSTSERPLLECDKEIIPEPEHSDIILSGSTTDSSPVNDLIEDSSSFNKVIEDVSPLSEHSEAYRLLHEPEDVSPLEGYIESHVVQELNKVTSLSHVYFEDDAPFHGFTEGETVKEHVNACTLMDNTENGNLSVNVSHLTDHIEDGGPCDLTTDTVSSHVHVEDAVSSHGHIEDAVSLHDHIEDAVSSHGHAEDAVSLHDHIEDSVSLHDHIEDSVSLHDHIEDAVSSHDRIEDAVSSHDRIEDAVSSHDHIEDAVSSHDHIEDALSLHDHIEDAVGSHGHADDAVGSHGHADDAVGSHGHADDAVGSHGHADDAVGSHGHADDAVGSHGHADDAVSSHDHAEGAVSSHGHADDVDLLDHADDAVGLLGRLDDAVGLHSKIEEMSSVLEKLDSVPSQDILHSEGNYVPYSCDIVSASSPVDQESLQTSKPVTNVDSTLLEVDESNIHMDVSSPPLFDLMPSIPEKLTESPFDSIVTSTAEPVVLEPARDVKIGELQKELIVSPSAPDSLLMEESECSKHAAEIAEKELKDLTAEVLNELESAPSSQTPPPTPSVVEPETEGLPKFEHEVLVETVEKLIVSPKKENEKLECLQEKVDDSVNTSVSDVAVAATAVAAATAAVVTGVVLATEKTDMKGSVPAKAPASLKNKKPLADKTKSSVVQKSPLTQKVPLAQKSPAAQKIVAASPRGSASKAPLKPSLSPTKTPTSIKKTPAPLKPKSTATTPVTPVASSTPTSTSTSTPRSKPLPAKRYPSEVKSPASPKPLAPASPKPSAPIQKVRPASAVTKTAATEKKPAQISNGTMAKASVKEQVAIKRTVPSAKMSVTSAVTAPKPPTSRLTTTKITSTTTSGMAPRPKNLSASTVGVTKPQARVPSSTITQKQVKETANKQISSARPSSAVSVSRTSTTSTTRRLTTGVTRTSTTTSSTMTTSPKLNLGSKVTTKKTTTITSRTSAPAKSKSQAIENNEQITTTVIATEMKVDPIETTQHALLE